MANDTLKTLHELKLPGMAKSWESFSETHQLDRLSLRDGMELMIQAEIDARNDNRIARLIHNAHFRQRAVLEQLETDTVRGISAASITDLATGGYISNGMTVIITGPAGTGKSYLASALGDRACRQGKKVTYYTMNMLLENFKLVKLEGRQTNFFRKMAAQDLLIIDDFGMSQLTGELQNDFEQIIDDRYNDKALIISSQLPVVDWYKVFQSELIAEACLDRIVHKSIRFDLKGESLRKKY
jgi:DNA replication protein DnaC